MKVKIAVLKTMPTNFKSQNVTKCNIEKRSSRAVLIDKSLFRKLVRCYCCVSLIEKKRLRSRIGIFLFNKICYSVYFSLPLIFTQYFFLLRGCKLFSPQSNKTLISDCPSKAFFYSMFSLLLLVWKPLNRPAIRGGWKLHHIKFSQRKADIKDTSKR